MDDLRSPNQRLTIDAQGGEGDELQRPVGDDRNAPGPERGSRWRQHLSREFLERALDFALAAPLAAEGEQMPDTTRRGLDVGLRRQRVAANRLPIDGPEVAAAFPQRVLQ